MRELEERLGVSLLKPGEEEDIDTLGGLVFALVGRVPARGELVRHPPASSSRCWMPIRGA